MALDSYNQSELKANFLTTANTSFTVIFNIEMFLKLIALGSQYFKSRWNLFDMFIVISADTSICIHMIGSSSGMKNVITVFRVLRILRIVRLLRRFENIATLLDSLVIITPNVWNVLLLLSLVIYVYALLGISLFAGSMRIEELDYQNNFSSLTRAILCLIRYSTGEDF